MLAMLNKGMLATAAMIFGLTTLADAQTKKEDVDPDKVLAQHDGTWDADVTVWPPGTEGKGMTSKAVETNTMLGSKWVLSDFKGEFVGQEFHGHGQFGYDAKKGKYVGTWLDSMSTSIANMEGTYDPATKTLTWYSDIDDPHTGKPMKTRMVTVFKGDTRVFIESVKTEGAKDFTKMMEIAYKKRAK